jgi:sulfatase maturation enzyme AslB (radical SAM superfamily)
MTINEKTFCIGPWSEIRIRPDGSLNYCHTSDSPSAGDTGYGDNIVSTDLDSYFKGPTVSEVRNDLLQGSPTKLCHWCYQDEKKIEFSYRRRRNIQMAIFPGEDFKKSLVQSKFFDRINSPNYKPLFYNISAGNLCNLACVMCNENWSSRLATEFHRIGIRMATDLDSNQAAILDWTRDDTVWEKFMQHILSNDQIVCIHFQGGEPLLHPRVLEFVDRCINQNHTYFHFTMVTNGTIYDDNFLEKLKKFQSVQLEISIETLEKSNDYVRWPSDRQKVMTNIEKYLHHRDDKLDVTIRTVPQLLTVLDYCSLLEKCKELDVIVDSNIINRPDFFLPNVLPEHLRILAQEQLQSFINQNQSYRSLYNNLNVRNREFVIQNLVDNASMVLASLTSSSADCSKSKSFLADYLRKIDYSRNIYLGDYCPEVAEWLYDQ